jgi:branched-chain amino acid transport system substrate-binding protein
MKEKALISIVFATLLIASSFTALTTKAAFKGTITVGIIGPVGLPHYDPAGMKPGAELAADEINAAGGVALADGNYQIVLKFADEHDYPTIDPAAAASEVERLITVEGCEYIIGGFRTETTTTMIEKAMEYKVPFIINGAATNELLYGLVNKSDPVKYAKYKYLFRTNPTNSSTLGGTIGAGIQYLVATKFAKLFGHQMTSPYYSPPIPPAYAPPNGLPAINCTTGIQVKVAVLIEDLAWLAATWVAFTTPTLYPRILGPGINVTYQAKIKDGTTDCTSYLQGVKDNDCRIMIYIFSGVTGDPIITQWKSMNVSALPVGINVLGQTQDHYSKTGGACEYETFTIGCGTNTSLVPGVTTAFWNKFTSKTGQWPIYTAFGAYDSVYLLANGLKAVGSKDKDQLVAYWEDPAFLTESASGLGHFKFDSIHDVFSNESSLFWQSGFVRTRMAQWQAQRIEIVTPVDAVYTKKWAIPSWVYPLKTDTNYDGNVNILDISAAATAFGTKPGDPRWNMESDVNLDSKINIVDLATIALDWTKKVTLPLP